MKKLYPLLSVLFLIYWGCDLIGKEKVIVYYDNGQVKSQGMKIKNGNKIGKWIYFYENGDVLKEEKYKNGKLNGLYRKFYSNGNIVMGGSYKDGLKIGSWTYFRENGDIQIFEYEYKEGKLDGNMLTYYENGKTKLLVSYSNGEITNTVFFNEDGSVRE